jgi:AcrR family transcriptional regulator
MESRARAARGSLTLEAIEEVALQIVDAEGIDTLTMRRVATELEVGAMSLYRHVRTKEELVERVAERALTELELPRTGTWHAQLEELFTNLYRLLVRHPAVLYADTARPLAGPEALGATDAALRLLRGGGLDGDRAVTAMNALVSYTFGAAMFRLNKTGDGAADYAQKLRGSDPEQLPRVAEHSEQLLARGGDADFAAGLALILEGIA